MNDSVEQLLRRYMHAKPDSLIPILQEIQDEMGFISEEAINSVAKLMNIPTSKIYGLATFYNQFRFKPWGRTHIQVCKGTSCHMFDSESLIDTIEKVLKIKPGEASQDGLFSLEIMPCIGACAHSPVIAINGKFYSMITSEMLERLLEELNENT